MTDHSFPLRPLFLSLGAPLSLGAAPSWFTSPLHLLLPIFHHWTSHTLPLRFSLWMGSSPLTEVWGKPFPPALPVKVTATPSPCLSSGCFKKKKKIPWTGWLKQPNIYFSVPEARSLKSGCRHTWVWGRVLFLVCKWLSSCYILTQGER